MWFLFVGVVACGDNPSTVPPTISISPSNLRVGVSATIDVAVTYTQSDGTTMPATDATFTVASTAIATVTPGTGGHVAIHGVAVGNTTMSIAGQGATQTFVITVAAPALMSIAITPPTPEIAAGTTVQLTATGTYSDSSTANLTAMVTWSSSATAKATVDAAGLLRGVAVGSSDITATLGTVTGTTTATITAATLTRIEVTPTNRSIALGTTQQLTATGIFSDLTTQDLSTQVAWESSAVGNATVSAAGLVTSVAIGATTIKATSSLASGSVSGSTMVTVTAAELVSIAVTPDGASLPAGRTLQYKAVGTFTNQSNQDLTTLVTWSSSTGAATISNAAGSQGLATGVQVGDTTISAALTGVTGSTTLSVTAALLTAIAIAPLDATVSAGTTRQFQATGSFTDAIDRDITTQVTWSSSDEAVATISNAAGTQGELSAEAPGPTTIAATLNGITTSTTLTVSDAVLVSIEVTPSNASAAIGHTVQFKAIGTFTDASTQDLTTQVTWASSADTIATVSNATSDRGLATAVALGTASISATFNGITGATDLTVTGVVLDSIAVSPPTTNLAIGATQQYAAQGTFSDGHTEDLTATATWTSSDATLATISAAGLATAVLPGSVTITATSAGVSGSAALVVVGLQVVDAAPGSGTNDVRASSPIVITFNLAIAPATLTTQTAAGACSGSLQLSADNFATCVGFATATPSVNAASLVATASPSPTLTTLTTYRIRVLGTVTTAGGLAMGADFTQSVGFQVAGACTTRVVISQVYGGGGNGTGPTAGQFRNDFIELHNIGSTPADLTGFAVQFLSAANTGAWAVQALPSVTIPPGGYFLIQEGVGASTTAPLLPTPDFVPTTPVQGNVVGFQIGATSGKVALTPTLTPLTGAVCATLLAASADLVGFGATASCFEGGAPTVPPSNTTSVQRTDAGCIDNNANDVEFVAAAPLPRNGAAANVNVCSCPLSFTDDEAGMSFLESP